MKKAGRSLVSIVAVLFIVGIASYVVRAAVGLSTTTAYTQNFDGMGTVAAAPLPTDFRVDKQPTARTVGTFAAALSSTALLGGASLSTTAGQGIYNFGSGTTATGPDRAVGFLSSGSGTNSGNLYAQLSNTTGSDLSGLKISYGVEKYRNGTNTAGFRIQMFYSTDGVAWTNAGNNFLTSFAADTGTNSGFTNAPGVTVPVTNQTLTVALPSGSLLYLAWNYSVSSGTTVTNAQALAIDDISILGIAPSGSPTNPSGSGLANPATVLAGNQTLLSVNVTPGANPTSTGLSVTADLSSIGGSPTQQLFDDGTHGDVTPNDNVFSFLATVAANTSGGAKALLATITDSQSRSGSTSVPLTVTVPTSPTGVGTAASVVAGNNVMLSVKVTPGANPASTGLAVTADLSAINGSPTQQFFDNGTNGDVTSGDNLFTFRAAVPFAASGTFSIPAAIGDAQSRTGTATIPLTVQATAPPTTVKISQVYGGGGNSGATYTNDFIEIYNQGPTAVNLAGWSVQHASAGTGSTWTVTTLCPVGQTCMLEPGHYYLVQESAGAGGTTPLPTPDATGLSTMGATTGKVALVDNTTALLSSACPGSGDVVDLVGYSSSASCSETQPTPTLSNTTAAIRKGNGCIDTDNNGVDFIVGGPIPRNSASPVNSCGGDPSLPSGQGSASPSALEPASNTLLTVKVTPALTPPSTGLAVTADLSAISGSATQSFFDDGTNGDATAGDNVFSFLVTTGAFLSTGIKNIPATVSDAQSRVAAVPVTLTISSPTCGVERWSVKIGTDPDAANVDLNPVPSTIFGLGAIPPPLDPPGPPLNARVAPTETGVYLLNATMTLFKKETDVDYHIVLQDGTGRTLIAEIPSPGCVAASSPFAAAVSAARKKFDNRLTATTFFTSVSIPVQVTGVGFFDFIHGQTGVAPNGIELHPVLGLTFTAPSSTELGSSANPSQFGSPIDITATVINTGTATVPTGTVTLLDGGSVIGTAGLDSSGHATFARLILLAGSHQLTASYEGDSASGISTSATLTQVVNKADQTIKFGPLDSKTYGDAPFAVSASTSSGLAASFAIFSGPATMSGNTVTITGAGTVTVRASQSGNDNFNAAPDVDASFDVKKAGQTITLPALSAKTYGDAPFTVSATGGGSTSPVIFTATGACASSGANGSTITITGGGSCTVTASQAGDGNYDVAPDQPASFTIGQAPARITVSGYTNVYDGHAHGAMGSARGLTDLEDLTSLLNFGDTFTDAPGGIAHWTFAGNLNYASASGDVPITISRATLSIVVTGYTGPYDGQPHGAGGGATGVTGEDLASLLNLGQTFTNVPGGTADWSFVGNINYNPASGNATITISKVTPSFSGLVSPTIGDAPTTVDFSGKVSLNTLIPTGTVAITLNGVTQTVNVATDDHFTSTFATPPVAAQAYTVAYAYSGDTNFNPTTAQSTLTVQDTTPPVITAHPNVQAEATSGSGAVVTYSLPVVTDRIDHAVVASCFPASGAVFALGTSTVTCNASDASGNAATPTTFSVIVRDTTPPAAPRLTVNPGVLWPPNNKMVAVTLTAAATDAVSASVCTLVNITSTDRDSRDRVDFMITGPLTASLRAEKQTGGGVEKEDLVYGLTVSCKDAAGNVGSTATINVIVPHDQGKGE